MSNSVKSHVDRSRETVIWREKPRGKRSELLHVEMAGITYPDRDYAIRRTRKQERSFDNLFVIEYVVSGAGFIESEGKCASVSAGDLYVIHRRTVHSYYADKEQPFTKKWINVSGTLINALEPVFLGEPPFTVLPLGTEAERIMDDIHSVLGRCSSGFDTVRDRVTQLLLGLFLLMDRHRRSRSGDMTLFDRITEYIEQNLGENITVGSLATDFFTSPSTLYRMFTANVGMSPKQYIQSRRLEAAKRMIETGEYTFNTIAAELGYYDSHHFFRAFRASVGMSPAEYRHSLFEECNDFS